MGLDLNADERKPFAVTTTVKLNLSNAQAWLVVDGTKYAVTWSGSADQVNGSWTRTGTTPYFAGPAVEPADLNNAVVLDYGVHSVKLLVKSGDDIVSQHKPFLTVRR